MRMPESFFSRVVFAYLPFMAYTFSSAWVWRAAALIVAVYWVTLAVFWFTRRLFPKGTAQYIFLFWLGLWGQAAWTLLGLLPLWVLSVYLLIPVGFLDENKAASRLPVLSGKIPEYFSERFLTGLGFFIFAGGFNLAGEFLGHFGHSAAMRGPAGIFFIIFLAAFLWKNQPVSRRGSFGADERSSRRR